MINKGSYFTLFLALLTDCAVHIYFSVYECKDLVHSNGGQLYGIAGVSSLLNFLLAINFVLCSYFV